jgi:hypothetical protein
VRILLRFFDVVPYQIFDVAGFDAWKVRRLAEFYPNDIRGIDLLKLELQLDNYIDVMRQDDNCKGINNLVDLSIKIVETKRDKIYDMIYLLLKLVLMLSVATTSVERPFSAMTIIKPKLRNKTCDSLLDDCLVTYIECDILHFRRSERNNRIFQRLQRSVIQVTQLVKDQIGSCSVC